MVITTMLSHAYCWQGLAIPNPSGPRFQLCLCRVLPAGEPIDLASVCFDSGASPDRLSALNALAELRAMAPTRPWRFIAVNATLDDFHAHRDHIVGELLCIRSFCPPSKPLPTAYALRLHKPMQCYDSLLVQASLRIGQRRLHIFNPNPDAVVGV